MEFDHSRIVKLGISSKCVAAICVWHPNVEGSLNVHRRIITYCSYFPEKHPMPKHSLTNSCNLKTLGTLCAALLYVLFYMNYAIVSTCIVLRWLYHQLQVASRNLFTNIIGSYSQGDEAIRNLEVCYWHNKNSKAAMSVSKCQIKDKKWIKNASYVKRRSNVRLVTSVNDCFKQCPCALIPVMKRHASAYVLKELGLCCSISVRLKWE